MNSSELQETLGVTARKLSALRKKGLPCKKKGAAFIYDEGDVAQWLLENGFATTDEPSDSPGLVLYDKVHAATALDVHERTLSSWYKRPGFPGIPGKYYPIDQIQKWREENDKTYQRRDTQQPFRVSDSQSKLAEIKVEMATLELKAKKGELLDADETERFFLRTCNYALAQWEQLPGVAETMLPAKTTDKVRKQFRAAAEEVVRRACSVMMELLEDEEDDNETDD